MESVTTRQAKGSQAPFSHIEAGRSPGQAKGFSEKLMKGLNVSNEFGRVDKEKSYALVEKYPMEDRTSYQVCGSLREFMSYLLNPWISH